MIRNTRLAAAALAASALLAACADGSAPTTGSQVRFNLASAAAAGTAFLSDTLATATDTLVLDRVQLVLRDIRFHRADHDECEDSDACEFSNAGPFLLDVPLDSSITKAFTVPVDTGTYKELRIKLHKPEDDGDAKDAAFLAAHPDFKKVSVRVTGTFNGAVFTYQSDLNAEERMDLTPHLVVADSSSSVDVTIKVDLSRWFTNHGSGLVDPATALKGGPNENLVRDNIRDSFRAFRDDDRDGKDD